MWLEYTADMHLIIIDVSKIRTNIPKKTVLYEFLKTYIAEFALFT